METMLEEGRLYKVDTRLRPSGEQGLLVTSWSAFERYHRDEAAGWERVALLRARVVYSNEEPAAARAARGDCCSAIAFDRPFDQQRFVADLRRVRARVETERGRVPAGSRHCASIRAGSWTSSSWSRSASSQTPPTTACGPRRRPRRWRAWWRWAGPASLLDDYAALRRATLRLRLLLDRPEDVVSPRDLPMLARSLSTTPDALAADLDARLSPRPRHVRRPLRLSGPKTTAWRSRRRGSRRRPSRS